VQWVEEKLIKDEELVDMQGKTSAGQSDLVEELKYEGDAGIRACQVHLT
jgi:hypothetical protein